MLLKERNIRCSFFFHADPEVVSLGYIEAMAENDISLDEFRKRVMSELDDVPANFIFTRRNVPIGMRQEKKRNISYVRSDDNVICIRIDSSISGDVPPAPN